jgi:hypothetical protein
MVRASTLMGPKSLIEAVAQPPRELTTRSFFAPPDVARKTTCQDQLTAGRDVQKYLPLESAILNCVVQDRWFIAARVGLSALTMVLVAAALFSLS